MDTVLRRRVIVVLLMSAVTALACGLGAPAAAPSVTQQADLATVTPGGRISVSLLTPTIGTPGIEAEGGTLIGPVATATSAAATAQAATLTAQAPTPTIPGVFAEPARCPESGDPTLPTQPPPFNSYAETIITYLSAGGPATILEARLRAWGALTEFGGLVRADRDFTGDGVPEVLVDALNPQIADYPYPGDLFVFGCEDGAYRLLYQAGSEPQRSAPILYSADDMDGNFLNDLTYVMQDCSGEICLTGLEVVQWSPSLGTFVSLLAEDILEPAAEVAISDVENDGIKEITVTSGVLDVPNAGPQRTEAITLRWDGAQYIVANVDVSPTNYRIHMIHDADEAFAEGDYDLAITLFARAAADENLLSWRYPDEREQLTAYAFYRAMLSHAAKGDVSSAQSTRNDLISRYSFAENEQDEITGPEAGQPGSGFAEMTRLFWQDFAVNRNLQSACGLVVGYARANPNSYEILNSFGAASPTYSAIDLCPFIEP